MKDRQVNAKVTFPTLGVTVLTTGQDIRRDENVEAIVHVGVNASGHKWFELYDTDTDGEKYHADGVLVTKDGKLFDYDGVGVLPNVVMDILRDEFGFDVDDDYDGDAPTLDYTLFKYWVDGKSFEHWNAVHEYIWSLDLGKEASRNKFTEIEMK
jgi:hypothetical protein